MSMSISGSIATRPLHLPDPLADPNAKLAIGNLAARSPTSGAIPPGTPSIAIAARRPESMAQAFAANRTPTGTARVSIGSLLKAAGFKPPPKDPSFLDRYVWGNDWDRVGSALEVAAESVNKPEAYKRDNPGFHYDKKTGSLMFADSTQGAQAYFSFAQKFIYLTTDTNGKYTDAANKFIEKGLPLLTSKFGTKLIAGLEKIQKDAKANESRFSVRGVIALDTLGSVLRQVAAVRAGARGSIALPTRPQRINPVSPSIRRNFGQTQNPQQTERSEANRVRRQGATTPPTITNASRIRELFSDPAKMAAHFSQRALGEKPGQSPTAYFFGGHANSGPFAGITGRTTPELMHNVRQRVEQLKADGLLESLGEGASNNVYLYKPTGSIIRVGGINSEELSATVSHSNLRGANTGAKLDLAQSLYIPTSSGIDQKRSIGFGVLVMERVPGITIKQFIHDNPQGASRLAKVPDKVADALVNIHMNRRAHNDLHEGNILFDEATGNVRIIDFGTAKRVNGAGQLGLDIRRLGGLIDYVKPPGSGISIANQAKSVYLRALMRYPGPDRNAPVYQKQPELYDKHLAQFNARKYALVNEIDRMSPR